MTVADLLNLPDDAWQYEVVDGVLVRVAGTRPQAGRVTRRLQLPLTLYVQAHRLGTVTLPDEVYDFEHTGQPNTGLLPDLGFYYAVREPLVGNAEAIPFAPDLAVEVASPLQDRRVMSVKARRYLAGGTALVWVIYPHLEQVDVWRQGAMTPTTRGVGESLDGDAVIPGFTLPLDHQFFA